MLYWISYLILFVWVFNILIKLLSFHYKKNQNFISIIIIIICVSWSCTWYFPFPNGCDHYTCYANKKTPLHRQYSLIFDIFCCCCNCWLHIFHRKYSWFLSSILHIIFGFNFCLIVHMYLTNRRAVMITSSTFVINRHFLWFM